MSGSQISSISGIYNVQEQIRTVMTFSGVVTVLSALSMDTSVLAYLTTVFGFLSMLVYVIISLNKRYPTITRFDIVDIINELAFCGTFFTLAAYLLFALRLIVVGWYYYGFLVCAAVFVLPIVMLRQIPPKIKLFLTQQ